MPTQRFLSLVSGIQTMIVPNIVSAGSSDSGKVVALNASGSIDMTMMPSGIGANTASATASATITASMLVNIYNNAGVLAVRPADSTAVGSECNGYCPAGITSATSGTVYLGAGIVAGLTGLTIGSSYYLGTIGAATLTSPSTAGNIVQFVGKAISATTLELTPSGTPVTVA